MRPMMTVRRSSVFPASADEIFRRLQRLDTLQYIASPLAAFSPTGETPSDGELRWEAGKTFAFRLRLFGVIQLGDHVIRVLEFSDRPYAIFTREANPFVPIWNHRIELSELGADRTRYTRRRNRRRLENAAGLALGVVLLWPPSAEMAPYSGTGALIGLWTEGSPAFFIFRAAGPGF